MPFSRLMVFVFRLAALGSVQPNTTALLNEVFELVNLYSANAIHSPNSNPTTNILGHDLPRNDGISFEAIGSFLWHQAFLSVFEMPESILDFLEYQNHESLTKITKVDHFPLKSALFALIDLTNAAGEIISAPVQFSFDITNETTFQDEVLPLYQSEADGGQVVFTELSWKCVFLTKTGLSDEGCQWKKSELKTEVRCECDHTTAFSVLLAVETLTVPYHVKILSFVMEGVSIFFLLITFFILITVRKQLHNDRTFVQINLSFSLCLFHSANIAHEVALYVPELCFPVAVTLQYFLLTSMFWMLIEGVTLAIKTSDQALHYTNMKSLKRNILRVFTGWVIPGLITLAAAISGYYTDSYLALSKVQQLGIETTSYQHDRCWMDPTSPTFIWSIVIPVCLVAFINLFILVRVACITIRLRRSVPAPSNPDPYDQEMRKMAEEAQATLKLVLILLPVLGIPLFLGFFVGIGSPTFILASMYTHVIVNGLQGFFIFVVYCVIDGGVMRCVTKELSKTFPSLATE